MRLNLLAFHRLNFGIIEIVEPRSSRKFTTSFNDELQIIIERDSCLVVRNKAIECVQDDV